MRLRGVVISSALDDLKPDASIFQGLFTDAVALPTSLQLGPLDGVGLQETVKMFLIAPVIVEVVELHIAAHGVDDDGIPPFGQLNDQTSGLTAVELGSALDRSGQTEALTGGSEADRIE